MKSCRTCPFVSRCFLLVCLQGSPVVWHVGAYSFYYSRSDTPVGIPQFIHRLMNIWVCFHFFGSLELLWTFVYRFWVDVFSFPFDIYLGVEFLGKNGNFLMIRKTFPKWLYHFIFPPAVCEGSDVIVFLYISRTHIMVTCFHLSFFSVFVRSYISIAVCANYWEKKNPQFKAITC